MTTIEDVLARSYARPAATPHALIEALAGFHLVYQGGHHSVFCNGESHKKTNGGYTGIEAPSRATEAYSCDCARWGNKSA